MFIPGAAAAAHGGEVRNGTVAAADGCTHVVLLRQSEAPNVGTVKVVGRGGERGGEVDTVVAVLVAVSALERLLCYCRCVSSPAGTAGLD